MTLYLMNVTYCRWMCDLIPLYEFDLIPPYGCNLIPLNVTLWRCMKATLHRRMYVTYRRMNVTVYRRMDVTYTAGWMWPYTDILMVPYTTARMWPYTGGWMWPYTAAFSKEGQFQTFLYHDILTRLRHTKLGSGSKSTANNGLRKRTQPGKVNSVLIFGRCFSTTLSCNRTLLYQEFPGTIKYLQRKLKWILLEHSVRTAQ